MSNYTEPFRLCKAWQVEKNSKFDIATVSLSKRDIETTYSLLILCPVARYEIKYIWYREEKTRFLIHSSRLLDGFERLLVEATFRTPAHTAKL